MSALSSITDADRRSWQMGAQAALGRLLDDAHRQGLRPIDWTVQPTQRLIGRVPAHAADDRCTARERFAAWCRFLGATGTEHVSPAGVVTLKASRKRWRDSIDVTVLCEFASGETP